MDFKPTKLIESTTTPGIRFTVRVLSQLQKAKRDLPIAEHRLRYNDLWLKYAQIEEPYRKATAPKSKLPILAVLKDHVGSEWTEQDQADLEKAWTVAADAEPVLEMPEEIRKELAALDYESGLILNAYMKPATIKAGFVSIEEKIGEDWKPLAWDGKKVSFDMLIESSFELLVDELWVAIEAYSGLPPAQAKNSQSPSDSPAPVVGESQNSIAPNANERTTSEIATAASSPSTSGS